MEIKLCTRTVIVVFAFLFCGQLIPKNNFVAATAAAFIYNVDFIHANVRTYCINFDVPGSHLSFRVLRPQRTL